MTTGKRPAFQWYPGDAQRDTALRSCSLEARGLWREMLDLMHDGEPYGYLTAGGQQIDNAGLAGLVGVTARRCAALVAELEGRKVFSRTDDGVIFSRRMVRDEHHRNVRAAGGGRSLLNENVPRPKDPPKDTFGPSLGGSPAVAVAVASAVAPETTSSSALDTSELVALLGTSDRAATEVTAFLAGIDTPTRRHSWLRNLTTALQGIGAPAITPEAMLTALADFNMADRKDAPYNAVVFRAFVDRAMRAAAETREGLRPASSPRRSSIEDAAQSAVTSIRALIQRNGQSEFIPKQQVEALGSDVLGAYIAVGGATRFLTLEPYKLPWLVKEFASALRAPGVTHAA